MNIYYETMSAVVDYLEKKYNEPVEARHVNYETTERFRGNGFVASVYRMPSGRYEVVDNKIKPL